MSTTHEGFTPKRLVLVAALALVAGSCAGGNPVAPEDVCVPFRTEIREMAVGADSLTLLICGG